MSMKITKNNYIFALIAFVASLGSGYASDKYAPFDLSKKNIQSALANFNVTPLPGDKLLPANITFACADIKYNKDGVKFCECGDGIYMSFRTAKLEINQEIHNIVTPGWGLFWNFLHQFNLPIWHVGDRGPAHALALEELSALGGRYAKDFNMLEKDAFFKKSCKNNFAKTSNIRDYAGIIVFRAKNEHARDADFVQDFQQRHPEFLFVNDIARSYVKRKDNTYKLFHDCDLDEYLPENKVYPAQYSNKLTEQILKDFKQHNLLVVKPVFSSLSYGVNVIDREHLDDLLSVILRDKKKISPGAHRCYAYWRMRNPSNFVVAQHVASKTISVRGNSYDPTMRVLFMMYHDKGQVYTTVIGGFWKIPVKHLGQTGCSLTDRRVTIAHAGAEFSGILVDHDDMDAVKKTLHTILPRLYQRMLIEKR